MIRVGILGAGGMGNVHARQYRKMSDVELFLYEPNDDRRNVYVERWAPQLTSSFDDLAAKVDVIDVCLPTDLHHEFVLKSLAAGRATLVEKPMARTLEQAAEMNEAAERAGVPFMVGHVVRYFAEFAAGNRAVASGKVGKPAAARTRRGGLAPTGSDSWFMDHSRSGGVLIDLGIHDFDWLRWTLGEVKSVYSQSLGAKRGQGPDYALTTLTFESGAIGHCEATWMDPSGFRTTFEVAGDKGLIQHDSRNTAALRTHSGGKTFLESPLDGFDDPYYKQLRAFVDAVRDGTPVPVTGQDGFASLAIALAALESGRTNRAIAPARP
ncbi:MAG: Gfo/Idh/MocA family oxidoreductase [Armatimonadetes bacterium]|nr:Gfo/Idh/MocA family oxidoreductase [Armatimonadota bacterium]